MLLEVLPCSSTGVSATDRNSSLIRPHLADVQLLRSVDAASRIGRSRIGGELSVARLSCPSRWRSKPKNRF